MEDWRTAESEFSTPGGTELLTVTRAAAEIGLTSRTLANFFERGIGPARTRVGSRAYITRASLYAWLKQNTECNAPGQYQPGGGQPMSAALSLNEGA